MFVKIVERTSFLANCISELLIVALMVVGIVGIVTRFAGYPISGILRLSVFVLVGSMYFAFAYAQLRKSHVALEFFVLRMRTDHRSLLRTIAMFLSVVACIILVLGIWPYAWASLETGECMDGEPFYPLWPVKFCAGVAASILLLQIISDFVKAVVILRAKTEDSENPNAEV